MCGIAGLWNVFTAEDERLKSVEAMTQALHHRGPESRGFESRENWAVGHARLAIIDVAGGQQPIWNESHSALIVGNNEIYNAPELRKQLQSLGHTFRTHSDTEVILHAWEEWQEKCFEKFNGMFAVAIIDRSKRKCILARDALGIKPLHVARVEAGFAFASEVKGILALDNFKRAPNYDAVHLFMNFRYVPDEQTLFEGVERVAPGEYWILEEGRCKKGQFFNLNDTPLNQKITYQEAEEELSAILDRSIDRHLISDVEVAAYLSGGIDSSLVSSVAAQKKARLKTYCMAFGEPTDENDDARIVAKQIGSDHHDFHVGFKPLDRYKEIIWQVEEPKINCVQGFLLAENVSKDVKVALSGLGGDELHAGYVNNDILYPMTKFSELSRTKRTRSLSALQEKLKSPSLDHFVRMGELGLNLGNPLAYYSILRNSFDHNETLMKRLYKNPRPHWKNLSQKTLGKFYQHDAQDTLNELLRLEARTKLVNDFLLTEDRVSMAHSLEVRVPLLDRELVRFSFSLPSWIKYQPGAKKRLLKSASTHFLGKETLNKKKWGFSFNPYILFETQLKDFSKNVLTRDRVEEFGVFSWDWIQQILSAPSSPRMRWHYFNLWAITGFHIWFDTFFKESHADFHQTRP